MLSCSLALLPQCSASQRYQAYCCVQISREKKTEKILITSCQLCWHWYLEDHPLDAAWHIRQLFLSYSCSLAPMLSIANASSILLRTDQPGKEDRKDSHHRLSALLSLIFGRSSSWCSMTNKATASSTQLECHRIKKRHVNHVFMLSCSLAPNALYHKRIKHTAAYKSAGKRRQKRFSSQVVSSVELDIWKIILLMQHDT